MDLVWFARPGENEELRYSIRSMAQNLSADEPWVIGHPPAWYTGRNVRPRRMWNKHWATTLNMRLALGDDRISDPFVYLNDDMFLFRPLDSVPVLNRGLLSEHVGDGVASKYFRGGADTLALLRTKGFADPLSFELHVPIVVHKQAMSEALVMIRASGIAVAWKRSVYGAIAGLTGDTVQDVKVADPKVAPAIDTWLSTEDQSFLGMAGDAVRERFPSPSPWEIPAPALTRRSR